VKSVTNIALRAPCAAHGTPHDTLLKEIYALNRESACHLRNGRVRGANVSAIVVVSGLATLQFVRDRPVGQITLLGFLVVVSVTQLMTRSELKRDLDECLYRVDLMIGDGQTRRCVALPAVPAGCASLMRLRRLYPALYLVTAVALGIACVRAVLPLIRGV
jgi:hypothetical protein